MATNTRKFSDLGVANINDSSELATATLQDDAVTGAKIENSPTIASNLTVSGTSTLTGNVTMAGNLTVNGTTSTVNTAVTVSDAMVINNAGSDVGLKVNSTSTGHILQLQDNGVDKVVVLDGGNVGIGQSAPGALLQVSVPYARTDTTVRDALFVSSNETDGSYSGLEIRLKGGSSDATRQAYLQTATQGSSDDGHLCLQTGGGNVGIGNNNPDDSKLSISGVAAGDKGVSINHSITNTYALHIDSEAEAQHSVFIDGANTTGNIIEVNSTGNALTTGRVLHIWSNSNTTNTRSLCKIHNDNASATGATCLEIVQDSTGPALAVSGDVTINSGHLNVKGGSFAQTLLHTSLILGY